MKEFTVWAETKPACGKMDKAAFFATRGHILDDRGNKVPTRLIKVYVEGLDLPEEMEGKPVKLTYHVERLYRPLTKQQPFQIIIDVEPTNEEPPPGQME